MKTAKEIAKEHEIGDEDGGQNYHTESSIIAAMKQYAQQQVKNTVDLADVRLSLPIEVLKRYEQWEANLILEPKCWENEYPELTEELYDELMEIQKLRNEALGNEA